MARVLVVDDDPGIRSLLRVVVERQGHTVDTAADGMDALDLLGVPYHYDLAIIDLMMPRLNGYDLLRELESYPNPPSVVMVTALDNDDLRTINSRLVHSVVRKPFDVTRIGSLIGEILGELHTDDDAMAARRRPSPEKLTPPSQVNGGGGKG